MKRDWKAIQNSANEISRLWNILFRLERLQALELLRAQGLVVSEAEKALKVELKKLYKLLS